MRTTKKVIISGISGQDGSYMADYLLANTDHTIIGGIRRTSQIIDSNIKHLIGNPRFKLHNLDLTDVHSITSLIKEEKPDYFINFGASTFVSDSWNNPSTHLQTNALALIHILEAIRHFSSQCRTYSSGSSEQWGDVKYSPQDEKHPMSPRSVYGVSKCAASHICKVYRESYGLYIVHGILCNHESERRQDYFVTRKITKGVARIKKAIYNNQFFEAIELGNLDARRDWSHAEDFVDGIWKMINQPTWETGENGLRGTMLQYKEYVLSSDETHSIREFINLAFSKAGLKIIDNNPDKIPPTNDKNARQVNYSIGVNPVIVTNPAFFRPADVELLCGNSSLIRKELGWKPKVSFDQLVQRMVDWDIKLLTH